MSAVLLLGGCSGDGNGGDDEIAADSDNGRSESPQPDETEEPAESPAPAEDTVERPDIQVADFLTLEFEEAETGDPVADAVLADTQGQIEATYEVLTTHDQENSSIGFYNKGQALIGEMDFIESAIDQNATSGGVMRFYRWDVELAEGGASATVSYCRDFTEVYDMDIDTREIIQEADPDALPTRYLTRVEKNGSGVWQTVELQPERKSEQCR
ncbi:hypothetical protein [Streptomyces sp. YIM 98790]|uniref:hypothetical protein n=1 Tax=Streptomyces sp. YIM 98790 TaxID=2689077 RepID=UPI001407772A|nr:hypothetical protein [Streptomyces sp. YIM 98790]